MSVADVAFLTFGILISFAFLILSVLRRWLIPGWAFADKVRESDDWKKQCDEATRLASLATTMAEQLSRASLHSPGANQKTP